MADSGSTPFYFYSSVLPEGHVAVLQVYGKESLSSPYRFEIDLVSDDPEIDLDAVLSAPASLLQIRQTEEPTLTHGILCSFEQLQAESVDKFHYRAVLMPRLWLLSLRIDNKIYQEKNVEAIIRQVFENANYPMDLVEFRLTPTREYPVHEYIVQYRESDLDFISRLMEHEGIFYFFEQEDDTEKLIIADNNLSFNRNIGKDVPYRTLSGMFSPLDAEEVIDQFSCAQNRIPRQVTLKDYNYRIPSGLDLKTEKPVTDEFDSTRYEYGNHYKNKKQGDTLAAIRAEELKAGQRLFSGQSDCPAFRPGEKFSLSEHFRSGFNREYVITEVIHQGWQAIAGVDGQKLEGEIRKGRGYSNKFTAISSDVAFRPKRITEKPRLYGIMNAKVDSATDGKYADIDEQGRYKLVMPFDISNKAKGGGKASRYMRMAQPYAGNDYGTHFPLHKDTEVIWACIDGDLDRPIICGAVPYPEKASPVTQKNQTRSIIRSASGNEIALEDKDKSQEFYAHAVRDMNTVVGHNESHKVAQTRTTTIGLDDNAQIKRHRTVHIDEGNETLVVHTGNQAYEVSLGDSTLNVPAGNRSVNVPAGVYQLSAKDIKLTATNSIEIVCGSGSIKMDAGGNISIDGTNLKSIAGGVNDIKGGLVKINT